MAAKKQSKGTNKNSKISKLTRVFNFSTTKGKFLVFMLTFAVIGGGFAVYQTFAASSSYSGSNLTGTPKSHAITVTETQGQKRDLVVWKLYDAGPGDSVTSMVFTKSGTASGVRGYAVADESARACAMVRSTNASQTFNVTIFGDTGINTGIDAAKKSLRRTVNASSEYAEYCTDWLLFSKYALANGRVDRYGNTATGNVRVSTIRIDYQKR